MKKAVIMALLLAVSCLFAGCQEAQVPENNVMIANPWSDWSTLDEAETAVGYALQLPETIGEYSAIRYRTMNGTAKLLEIVYSDGAHEVTVRKAEGEGQDISGVYGHDVTETKAWETGAAVTYGRAAEGESLKMTFAHGGSSWSVWAPDGLNEAACDGFLAAVFE